MATTGSADLQTSASPSLAEKSKRQAAFLGALGPVIGCLGILWVLLYLYTSYPWPLIAAVLPVTALGFWTPFAVRSGVRASTLAILACVTCEFAALMPIAYTGGVRSYNIIWLVIVPTIAIVGGAQKYWPHLMVSIVLGFVSLAVVDVAGWLPEPFLPYPIAIPLVAGLCAITVMMASILIHHRLVEKAMRQEQSISAILKREVDQHRRTQAALIKTQQDLIETGRIAGMAEIANGVLHSVGNGLNTVNVAVALLSEHDSNVPVSRLEDLAGLVECEKTPPELVGKYLRRIATVAREQQATYQADISRLRQQVDHVNTIIQAQQHHARHGGLVAHVTLSELVEDTLLLVTSGFTDVHVEQALTPDIRFQTDRHKTMLVLLNLVNNAVDAVRSTASPTITIKARTQGELLMIEVADNGVGVKPENLDRIFQHGFTTKVDGHGFGLHSSAIAARELGGQLTVHSEGPGLGTTFCLALPLDGPARRGATPPPAGSVQRSGGP